MSDVDVENSLAGKSLIAMPDMPDPRFQSSVIFLTAHSEDGAMGLIVNKCVEEVRLRDMLEQLSIPMEPTFTDRSIQFGGPVEPGRGFVLHSADYRSELSSQSVTDEITITATIDILEDIGKGLGPRHALFTLGYAGWGPGQLEQEISVNGWLVADAGADVLFETPDDKKWSAALGTLGIDPAILSSSGGSA